MSCYLQTVSTATNRDCGQNAAPGEPIGLLTEDGSVYLLMAEEHHHAATA